MAVTTNFADTVLELVTDITSAETATLSNALYVKAFEVGTLTDDHTVIPGVRQGNVIPIIGNNPRYDKFPYKDPTNCTLPACDIDLPFEAKAWQIGMIACKTSVCLNTFNDNFLAFWGNYKKVLGEEADIDTALVQFMLQVFERDLKAAMWRIGYFGDTSLAGNALLRPIDGVFTQAEAGDGYKIEVTQESGLTGPQLYDYLTEAYLHASEQPWFDPANLVIEMTAAMASVLVAWMNSLGDRSPYNCECFSADGLTAQRGYTLDGQLRIFGIPIRVYREFDGVINQLNLDRKYRALLTTRDNILIGTPEVDKLPDFRVWYSQDDNLIYIAGGAAMGVTLVTDDYVYIGAEVGTNS